MLETEVIEFFRDTQNAVVQFFQGPEGLAALILVLAASASIYGFNRINR